MSEYAAILATTVEKPFIPYKFGAYVDSNFCSRWHHLLRLVSRF